MRAFSGSRPSLGVTLSIGITSRPTFELVPVGLACWSLMGRWSRLLSREHPAATVHHAGAGTRYATDQHDSELAPSEQCLWNYQRYPSRRLATTTGLTAVKC